MADRLKAEDQASTAEQRTNDSGFGEINCGTCDFAFFSVSSFTQEQCMLCFLSWLIKKIIKANDTFYDVSYFFRSKLGLIKRLFSLLNPICCYVGADRCCFLLSTFYYVNLCNQNIPNSQYYIVKNQLLAKHSIEISRKIIDISLQKIFRHINSSRMHFYRLRTSLVSSQRVRLLRVNRYFRRSVLQPKLSDTKWQASSTC